MVTLETHEHSGLSRVHSRSAGRTHVGYRRHQIADPEGTDLESTPEVVIRSDSIDGDCGYPWAVQLEDGRVLVVYYYVHPDGVRGIEATTLEER